MNDPHVKRLHYRIKHDQFVYYDRAPALVRDTALFTARIEGDRAVLEMKAHFSGAEEAKEAVAPVLTAWEIWAGLDRRPGEFEFSYERCDIVRQLGPVAAIGSMAAAAYAQAFAAIRIDRETYPVAPDHFKACEHVRLMYSEYKQYREGKWKLAPFAYLIYDTIIEICQKQTSLVEKTLGLHRDLLCDLRDLSSEKGGRKYKGHRRRKSLPMRKHSCWSRW
jgi:hypothetical protein